MENERLYVKQALEGDANAFARIVQLYKDRMYGLALRIVRSPHDAEDLVQDAFVKAYENLHRFKGKSQLSTWLYSITYNAAISFTRKKRAASTGANRPDPSCLPAPWQGSDGKREAQLRQLEQALERLRDDDRAIILLHYRQGCGVAEIAKIVGMSASNVKVRLHRARKKLQDLMSMNRHE
ncbi:MAG: RNA polymerase sigma factor [Prevotellaceae bacterium]|jgi:RNA polymerase sigma-70 factor (ECF subfamily)|nr:RNA polymerase sigma factor [Prevotellaceae bacterium]